MNQKLTGKQYTLLASMLFGMIFGAGNLIFPIILGAKAGASLVPALLGMLITAVGMPLLGIVALGVSRSSGLMQMSGRVAKWYSYFFTCALYLTIGPFFAPLVSGSHTVPQAIFTTLFFAAVLFFALRPNNIMNSIGKYLNPIFLICLGILVVAALLDPIQSVGSVAASGAYADNAFSTGFLQGYDTLDALASLAFGIIVVNVIKEMGVEEPGAIAKNTIKSGVFSMVLMTVIYALIAIVGAQSYGLYADQLGEPSFNGGNAFAIVAQHYLGKAGMIVLALTVTFCCMKTAIGLVTACADTFSVMFPRSLSYRSWAIVFTAFSLLVSNIGLSKIISFSAPVLYFLYPLAIMLILLNIFGKYFDYARPVFTWAIGFTMIAAVFDLLKVAGLAQGVVDWVSTWLPFYSLGLGWIVPGAVGTMIGLIIAKPGKKTA